MTNPKMAAAAAAALLLLVTAGCPRGGVVPSASAFAPSPFLGARRAPPGRSSSVIGGRVRAAAAEAAEAAEPLAAAADSTDVGAEEEKKEEEKGMKKKKKKKRPFDKKKSGGGGVAAELDRNGEKVKDASNAKKKKTKKKPRPRRKKEELLPLSSLKLGQTISGYVAGLAPFGAFVRTDYNLRGDGESGYALLHISQISNERIDDLADVLRVGQRLDGLRVVDVNYATGEVGLSLRPQRQKRFPLSEARVGREMEGRITSVVPYGAFVDVGCKVNALLHKSRISAERVDRIEDHVKEGDTVKVRIIDVDLDKRTMAASMLEEKADEYLDRRQKQRQYSRAKRATTKVNGAKDGGDDPELHKEVQFFEEAIKELEEAFK